MRTNPIDQWSVLAGMRFALASVVAINHLAEYSNLGVFSFVTFGTFEAILGFLLISGYSIGVSYLNKPKRFIFRRLRRVYPIYLASIIVTIFVGVFIQHEKTPPVPELAINLLFLNQLLTTSSLVGPAWSLSLEFWLYCLAPYLVSLCPARNRLLVYISFCSYLAYTACRTLFHLPYYSGVGYGGNLLFLSFIWICGLLLARHDTDRKVIQRDIAIIFAGHIAISAGIQFLSRVKHQSIGMFLTEDLARLCVQSLLLCVIFVICVSRISQTGNKGQRSGLLRFLGDISYPLYLVHIPVYISLSATPLKSAAAYYMAALAAAAALYWTVDDYSKKRHLLLPSTDHSSQ